jgi:hypothetical protein
MSKNLPLYNVNDYTDVELYNILDLVNPTDRELEAKILMQIHKYENIGTKSAQKLARFFDDIYNHFFETEENEGEEAEMEGYANQTEPFETISNSTRINRAAQSTIDANIADSNSALDPTKSKQAVTNNMITMADKSAPEIQTVGYTQNLAYTKGKLNPILQQTTKRIISIDSQYRSDKRTMSTSFTFNLSEPLKDVVSLKLYSVQIPYTWYTIGKAYGNNFFYIKGRTSGINSGSGIHDIEVSIAPGNYSPAELIGAVNNSIANLKKSRTDISLGNTAFSYNYNTSLTTANIDLKNGYNQSSYVIKFNNSEISNYLGFIQTDYSIRTLRSRIGTYDISSSTFNVSQNNNYFTIKLYEDNFTTLKSSFNIAIDMGAYTRSALINKLKTTLSTLTSLTDTDCSISTDRTYIDLTLQPSRSTNAITINTKTQIVFYNFQYYNVDFTNTIFTNASRDISGNIGNAITGNISLIINPTLIDGSGQIIIPGKQLLCKIKTKFYNGNSTLSYNNAEIFHEIKSAFNSETTYNNLPRLYSDLASAFTSYEYAGIKIFAGTTVASNGTLSLSVVADDRIWTNLHGIDGTVNLRSCFGFEREINNMNETNSELPATEQSGDYTIYTEPFVYFTPNNALYRDDLNGINDLSFSVPNSSATGSYKMNDYINVINQSIRNYDLLHNNVFSSQENAFNNTTAYPVGTHAYLQNNIFQLHVGISKIFDASMYIVDLSGSIFDNTHVNNTLYPSKLLNDLSIPYQTNTDNANIGINVDTIVFTLKPKLEDNSGNAITYGNKNEPNVVIRLGDMPGGYLDPSYNLPASRQMDDIIEGYIQPLFTKYTDPLSNIKILKDSVITTNPTQTGFNISLKVDVKKTLLAKDYRISFNDATAYNFTWNANLKISTELLNNKHIDTSNNVTLNSSYKIYDNSKNLFDISANQVDSSGNILDSSGNILGNNGKVRNINNNIQTLSGRVMYTVIPNGNVKISGISAVPQLVPIDINVTNNAFSFKAVDDGVATSTALNDVIITIPAGIYFRDTLINAINAQLRAALTNFTIITGTEFSIVNRYDNYYTTIVTNLKREYTTSDYNLVFYDKLSFATCTAGTSSVQNTTWDTTIGWIMGFREYTTYDMSVTGTEEDTIVDAVNGNVITIIGDTGLSTNLYNYFLICLDDFNQNHLNDGLVTITNVDTSIPLPSYASRTDFVCDPVTGQKVYNVSSGLTERQIYAAQAAANSRTINESIGSSISANSYGSGPFVSDVFGIIPMKVSGLANGSSYVEFGGTLQNQERSYFGPVNIHRMSVRLVTDRGNLVDLNKANWSFSLVCEQLNKLDPTSTK